MRKSKYIYGGSWRGDPCYARVSRPACGLRRRYNSLGFRLVRPTPPAPKPERRVVKLWARHCGGDAFLSSFLCRVKQMQRTGYSQAAPRSVTLRLVKPTNATPQPSGSIRCPKP